MVKQHGYDMQNADQGLHRFFDVYRLPVAIAYTESILEAATLPKVWRQEPPANVLCFMEHMEQLFTAAGTLLNSYATNDEAITATGVPGIITAGSTTGSPKGHAWDYFPRSLTAKQYNNPLSAISQCCSYMPEAAWKELLHDITECALSNTTLYDMLPDCNISRVRRYLLRLLEGCYLIRLRGHDEKGIIKKPVRK